jgi:hypothetical protein
MVVMVVTDKDQFHRDMRRNLRALADALCLKPNQYSIRSNKAGPAVLGEVTLHADWVYVQVGGSYWTVDNILVRSCKGQADYTGGVNQYVPLVAVKDMTVKDGEGRGWDAGWFASWISHRVVNPEWERHA